MRRILIAAAAAMVASAPVQANELARVYDMALTNDTQLRAAQHAYDAAAEARPQAQGALLPNLGAQASIGKIDQTSRFSGTGNIPPQVTDTTTDSWGVQVTLPVYDHSLWVRLSQSKDRIAAAQATLSAAQQSLALRVTQAYFNVLGATDSLRFAKAENKAVGRQLEQAQKRFEVGLSAITDVHEAQARYDLTVSQMLDAEQQLRNAKDALVEITGGAIEATAPLREDIPLVGPSPASVQEWIDTANTANLDLLAASINANIAKKDVRANRAAHFPTLNLVGQYGEGSQGSNQPGISEIENESQTITLTLNVPIYSGGITQSRVRQARSTHEQRLAELEGTRRSIERQVRNAFQGVETGVARVKALKQAVVSNTTALEASETGLKVGARTAVDVLNAQRELYRAQRDYARARYDYLISVLQLKQAAGQLTEADLLQIDKLLVAG